ncbi:MAG: hypothetical protein HYZ14_15945 [Bacteroidetes bacterium]|nr:hypothetical protein [Bacteroidota bacterium]
MYFPLLFLFMCLQAISFSQCLNFQFAEIGYEPALCRTAAYQSGNGVVYAAATGGTEPYNYLWTDLQTGQTTNNTTWGGLNPGNYKVQVTDSTGCVLTEIVKVDSTLPIADFEISSVETDTAAGEFLSAEVKLINKSVHCGELPIEWPDANYFWNVNGSAVWTNAYYTDPYVVEVTQPGFYQVCLIAQNNNHCQDTACKSISITAPVFENDLVQVFYASVTGQVSIELLTPETAYFNLVSVSGGTAVQLLLEPGTNSFEFDSGIYQYEIVSTVSFNVICSGTIAIY